MTNTEEMCTRYILMNREKHTAHAMELVIREEIWRMEEGELQDTAARGSFVPLHPFHHRSFEHCMNRLWDFCPQQHDLIQQFYTETGNR